MRSLITAIILTTLVVIAGTAQASTFPLNDINTLESYLAGVHGHNGYAGASYEAYTGDLSGSWDLTAIAYEAQDTDQLTLNGSVLFSTADTSAFGTVVSNVDLSNTFFTDVTTGTSYSINDSTTIKAYVLTDAWTIPGLNLTLDAGTLIIGFNDSGSPDADFDDLILAATPTNATPIPGAVWLLGSGLLGLVGLRRRNRD
ncbi:MAG: hypothetical protein AB7E32_05580 [Desulfovibrio sp.]